MKKPWILLGEDDANDAMLTQRALSSFEPTHEIVVAKDGPEVLDQLNRRGSYQERGQGHPAVVLLDLKMPKMDGLEVLRQVKGNAALKCIPIVMLSSSRHEPDVKHCYQLGANGYIVKPMDFKSYTEALHDFARFWLKVNEVPPANVGPFAQ